MNEIPLTREQRDFASKNHDLVYNFLTIRNLPEEEYYDVIIFGFLGAVRRFFMHVHPNEKTFSELAYREMYQSLAAYKKSLERRRPPERITVQITYEKPETFNRGEPNRPQDAFSSNDFSICDLKAKANPQQITIIDLITDGYGVQEVARKQHISESQVHELLLEVYALVSLT